MSHIVTYLIPETCEIGLGRGNVRLDRTSLGKVAYPDTQQALVSGAAGGTGIA
jgi:hypothetical protein